MNLPRIDGEFNSPAIEVTLDRPTGFFEFANSLGVSYIFFRDEEYIEGDPKKRSVKMNFLVSDDGSIIKGHCNFTVEGPGDIRDRLSEYIGPKNYGPAFIRGRVKILGDYS